MRSVGVMLLALCAVTAAQAGESVALVVLPSSEVSKGDVALVDEAASAALANGTSFQIVKVDAALDASCAEQKGCLAEMAKLTGADHLLALVTRGAKGSLSIEGIHATPTGVRFTSEPKNVDSFAPEESVPSIVNSLLPKHGLRGFGGLEVRGPAGSTVKVDGVAVPNDRFDPIPLPAGLHEVDVKLSEGRSVLYRLNVVGGEKQILDVKPASVASSGSPAQKDEVLRWASYGLFSAGAVAVATSLVFGGLARTSMNGLRPCEGTSRDCSPIDEAREKQAAGAGLANTGNGLLVLGSAMLVGGTALFTFDELGKAKR